MDFLEQVGKGGKAAASEAEVKVDLCGMKKEDALQKLDHVVRYCKKTSAATLYVSFDPARPGGGETLFQPVARYFKFEKFNGYVETASPVISADAAGLLVRFRM